MSDIRQRAALTERAARAGGAVARNAFRGPLDVETKGTKNDLVTDADLDAQRQVVHTLAEEFPGEPLVCEETPASDREDSSRAGPGRPPSADFLEAVPAQGPCWVVDPIDGTGNFARGIRLWGTSVAAMKDGEAVAAATYLPSMQDIYTAGPDSATRNGDPLGVSERTDPETFAVGMVAYWAADRARQAGALTESITARFGDSRRFGSTQTALAFVASGELEAAVTTEPITPWDTLAGAFLVRQAGGVVTGLDGEPWTLDSEGLVASNDGAHGDLVEAAAVAVEIDEN